MDVALLRPGRIDKAVYCSFPDPTERLELLRIYLRKFNFRSEFEDSADHERFLNETAESTRNFTSADIKGLIQNAQLEKMSWTIKENTKQGKQIEEADGEIPNPKPDLDFSISEKDVKATLLTFVKGMNEAEMQRFLGIYKKYQDKGQVTKEDLAK